MRLIVSLILFILFIYISISGKLPEKVMIEYDGYALEKLDIYIFLQEYPIQMAARARNPGGKPINIF